MVGGLPQDAKRSEDKSMSGITFAQRFILRNKGVLTSILLNNVFQWYGKVGYLSEHMTLFPFYASTIAILPDWRLAVL